MDATDVRCFPLPSGVERWWWQTEVAINFLANRQQIMGNDDTYYFYYYLVGGDWNMNGLWLSRNSWEFHHPKWLSLHHFSEGWLNQRSQPTGWILENFSSLLPYMAMYSIISMNMCLYVYIYDAYIYIYPHIYYTHLICVGLLICVYIHM